MLKYVVAHFKGEVGVEIGITNGIGHFYLQQI